MSAAKFEKLIDLIINEDQERAEQLFHEIVVEKSREIYESLMDTDLDEDMSEDLMSEIEMEETDSMTMEDDEESMDGDLEVSDEMDDEEMSGDEDFGGDEEGDIEDMGDTDMGSEEPATKGDLMNLEDKLDQLMAEFEAEFGDAEDEEEVEMDSEEEGEEEGEGEEEEESGVMESVDLKKVAPAKMGDDGAQKVSPVAKNSGSAGMASKPVNFAGGSAEAGGKVAAPKAAGTKYKNSPDGGKNVGDGKGESAPKPKTETVKAKSPVPESRKIVKKMVK